MSLQEKRVAEIISTASGRHIDYVQQPIAEVYKFSPDAAKMSEWFDEVGYRADITALRRDYPEVGWHTFEEWAKAQSWRHPRWCRRENHGLIMLSFCRIAMQDCAPLPQTMSYLLAQVCKLHCQLADELLNGIGLHVGQEMVLCALWEMEGVTQTELGDHLAVRPATVTNALKRLERKGLVERVSACVALYSAAGSNRLSAGPRAAPVLESAEASTASSTALALSAAERTCSRYPAQSGCTEDCWDSSQSSFSDVECGPSANRECSRGLDSTPLSGGSSWRAVVPRF